MLRRIGRLAGSILESAAVENRCIQGATESLFLKDNRLDVLMNCGTSKGSQNWTFGLHLLYKCVLLPLSIAWNRILSSNVEEDASKRPNSSMWDLRLAANFAGSLCSSLEGMYTGN